MKSFFIANFFFAALLCLIGCTPKSSNIIAFTISDIPVKLEASRIDANIQSTVREEIEDRVSELDPLNGDVLGRLNTSEPGEIIPSGEATDALSDLLAYTRNCSGAFDPTLQILWDVYDFENGGRFVSDTELAGALQWVDYHEIEMDRGGILRKNENVRLGFGPLMPGLIADWMSSAFAENNISGQVLVDACVALYGENSVDYVYDVRYPLREVGEEGSQLTLGHIKLQPGEYLAGLDDGTSFYFAHGEQYHQILSPSDGKPVRLIRAAIVVSNESCLQAAVYAYAVMVMGAERGLEFLDETEGVDGVVITQDHQVIASGGLGERFWR